ncbi:hypothetical protein GO003_014870 [Methylicorpusculum oleiharenae]|uniref:hypothetical protein n=1 Tax=Methylicorpusculum oleiharenae TaxID=1338687 RepID=UPI001359CC51|nr:hypothetical protein [Methylicorpusculum oleiharenae]MCD2451675.1 hypothetical protein [Methylicorpusculum oleiharenae]
MGDIEDINEKKELAFYAAGVSAWLNTSMEHDKSLLTLSAGGIGILLTLIRTVGIHSPETLVLYVGAIIGFLICLVVVLVIFKKNRTHIEQVLKGHQSSDSNLAFLDNVATGSFGIGALLSTIIGISSAIQTYTIEVTKMTTESSKQFLTIDSARTEKLSVNGISNMAPKSPVEKKSFDGISALKPQAKPQDNQSQNQKPPGEVK